MEGEARVNRGIGNVVGWVHIERDGFGARMGRGIFRRR